MPRVRSKVRSKVKVSGHGEHARILCWRFLGMIDKSRLLQGQVGDARQISAMISAKLATTKVVRID